MQSLITTLIWSRSTAMVAFLLPQSLGKTLIPSAWEPAALASSEPLFRRWRRQHRQHYCRWLWHSGIIYQCCKVAQYQRHRQWHTFGGFQLFAPRGGTSETIQVNPLLGVVSSDLNDLNAFLDGDGSVRYHSRDPYFASRGGLTTGVIDYSTIQGPDRLGTMVNAHDVYDSSFAFSGGTGAVSIADDVDDTAFVTGSVTSFFVGNNPVPLAPVRRGEGKGEGSPTLQCGTLHVGRVWGQDIGDRERTGHR